MGRYKFTSHSFAANHKQYVLVSVLALVLMLFAWASNEARQPVSAWEEDIFRAIYGLPDSWRFLFLALTQFGSALAVVGMVLAAYMKQQFRLALRLFIAGGFTYFLVLFAKLIIDRPRPVYLLSEVSSREVFVTGLGFPSGHMAVATALSLTFWSFLPKRFRFVVPVWIVGVGISRIYLGVHTPLDVIGGFILGVFVVCLLQLILRHHRFLVPSYLSHSELSRTSRSRSRD